MILTPHLIAGAAIASQTNNLFLTIFISFFSHHLLDAIPHWDYKISFKKRMGLSTLKITADMAIGVILILTAFFLSVEINFSSLFKLFLGAFFSILPDGFQFLAFMFPYKPLKLYLKFHRFFGSEYKKSFSLIGLSTQIIITILGVLIISYLQ